MADPDYEALVDHSRRLNAFRETPCYQEFAALMEERSDILRRIIKAHGGKEASTLARLAASQAKENP